MAAASQMIAGGLCLLLVSLIAGEMGEVDLTGISARSWFSLVYLVVMGSIVAYTAYLWLLRVATVARVSTYAYVNPVVAAVLGAGLAGETLTTAGTLAGVGIVFAVALIFTGSSRPGPRAVSRLEASK